MIEVHPSGDKALVYNQLTLKKAIVSRALGDFISGIPPGGNLQNAITPVFGTDTARLVSDLETDDESVKLEIRNMDHFRGNISLFYVIPASHCNLDCEYCSIPHKPFGMMDARTVELVMDRIIQTSKAKGEIILYGGEPLLNWPAVEAILKRIDMEGRKYRTVLITNGTLIDEAKIDTIQSYGVQLSVSIDGPAVMHDAARVFKGGVGSHAAITPWLWRLNQRGVPFSISCTVGSHNCDRLVDVARYFVEELHVASIGFNIMHGKSRFQVDITRATRAMLMAFEFLREKGIYEDRIMRKVRSFVESWFHVADCAGCGNELTFNPDGSVGGCHLDAQRGNASMRVDAKEFDDHVKQSPYLNEWRNRVPLQMAACTSCPVIATCGGGCPLNARDLSGTIHALDEDFCKHTKQVFAWMVDDVIKRARDA